MFKNKNLFFWIATLAILLGLTLPTLIQEGMFMDAVFFATVSKNLANDMGTFWFPILSKHGVGGFATMHEQPPLFFGIQALFFKLFGNSMYTERIYVLTFLLLNAWLIHKIWNVLFKHTNIAKLSWAPIIIWIITPICFWAYSNNMIENTLTTFILLSVFFFLKSVRTTSYSFLYLTLSALSIFLATFTKGIPGFFPIAVPALYFICVNKQNISKTIIQTIVLIGIPLIIYFVLFNLPESKTSLTNYFFGRVLHRIGEQPTVDSRFYILWRLFSELLPSQILTLLLFFIFRKKNKEQTSENNYRLILFFILIGLAGSLPLLLTLVQKGFYFTPSLPFFAIGFTILFAQPLQQAIDRFTLKSSFIYFKFLSLILLGVVLFISVNNIGKIGREKDILNDVKIAAPLIGNNNEVSIPATMLPEWTFQCYLLRYHFISYDVSTNYHNYYVTLKGDSTIPTGYKLVPATTKVYDLYKK